MIINNTFFRKYSLPILICVIFFILYSILSVVRHNNYQSFGYDLGINDQLVWEYSKLSAPISTIGPNPGMLKIANHVEIIFALIAPFYWIWSNPITLLILQSLFFCSSGIAIFLLAKKMHINNLLTYAILITYLVFYGVQNALWFDVHSIVFGASFLAWFLYFLQEKKTKLTILFFILTVTSKENFAFITFAISLVYFINYRKYFYLFLGFVSALYLFFIFFILFPHILNVSYLYANKAGLLSNLNIFDLFNTGEKINVIAYTLANFGFIPVINPLMLIPLFSDLGTYFVIGSDLNSAQGLFMQYRITLAPIMSWATIMTIKKYKVLNNKKLGFYLLFWAIFVQYNLHLPLSYLSKQWFWQQPASVKSINYLISNNLPPNVSVVAQNNIIPHISQRNNIYELYPQQMIFKNKSVCNQNSCDWFRWEGNPAYLIVDTASSWDIRHLLANRDNYIKGLNNLEKMKIIKPYKTIGTTTLYKILDNPDNIK